MKATKKDYKTIIRPLCGGGLIEGGGGLTGDGGYQTKIEK